MFGTLSQGSTLYVLDKSEAAPSLKIATIETTSAQTGTFMPFAPNLVGQTVDIAVVFPDGGKSKFEKLPAANSVFSYEKAVVTENRETMQQQVESAVRASKAVIESVPYHQQALERYEQILTQLSPTFAKERETDERLSSLERGLGDIKSMLAKVVSNNAKNKI